MRLAPDMEESRLERNRVPDGELGFEIPQMTQEVVLQLLNGRRAHITALPGIDPRYAPKPRY